MSVSTMKKLTVFAHDADVDAVVRKLMRLRCVEINRTDPADYCTEESKDERLSSYGNSAECAELERRVARVNEALDALNKYTKQKRSLINPLIRVDIDKFVASEDYKLVWQMVDQTLKIMARRDEIKSENAKLDAQMQSLSPWLGYDIPLGIDSTVSTDIILGSLPPKSDLTLIGKKMYAAGSIAEKVEESADGVFIAVFCHKSDTRGVLDVLAEYGFVRTSFTEKDKAPRELYDEAEHRKAELYTETEALVGRLSVLAEHLDKVEVLFDAEQTSLNAALEKQKLASTQSTAVLVGWIPLQREERVAKTLDRFDCAYDIEEASEDDVPPILLKNNGFATNFEWVLEMYSYPAYGKFDPTFIMSIFYFIIFGIMFADAGYGLLLVLACFGAVKLLKPRESMKRFLYMFGYCGFSCIFFGVLFGSYFGDLPLAIMQNMMGVAPENLPNLALLGESSATLALLFDPIQNPMLFLILSLAVGAIHLIAGMAVKFVILCREGHPLDAVFDIGLYWSLFAGVAMLFLLPSVGKWVLIGSAVLIVLTHGRKEKNIILKLMKGFLGIYDLVSYISDLLSYSRILALGLAAAVIAQVVNILGTMGGPTVGGFIGFVVIFIIGHLLNLALNLLGTFVHTARLQYIEFFNKFYEDGGRPFEPATPSDKYTADPE
ncbi:MAG: V-type ATP synthase subunit I [Eubacteriales bacterium]